MDPEALISWLPPGGMTGRLYEFDPTEGGGFRMALTYESQDTQHLARPRETRTLCGDTSGS